MSATAADVLGGRASWAVECADAVEFLRSLPDDSVDLLFTSPPYELAIDVQPAFRHALFVGNTTA